jgi:hypothetical protein
MTMTNGKIAAIEAENAMLRQRISELEAQLTSRNDHIAPSNKRARNFAVFARSSKRRRKPSASSPSMASSPMRMLHSAH